ncbi:MAG: MFS transporter [Dehalococcoidales bacterium]
MTDKGQAPNKWLIVLMANVVFIGAVGMPFTAMPVLFSSVTRELQLTLAHVGMIWGALPLGVALFSILGGLLGDRFDLRKVIGIGCFAIAIANGLRGFSGDAVTLIISMFLCGASLSIVIPNLPKIVGLFFPPRQMGMAFGIVNSGFNIGAILATALGATFILPLVGSWRNVLFFYSAICIVLGITWLSVIRKGKSDQAIAGTGTTERKVPFREALATIIRVKELWFLVIANVGVVGSYIALMGYIPVYLESAGVLKITGDTIASTIFMAGIIGAITLPALSDRIGTRKIVLITCAAVMGISTYFLSISGTMLFWLLIPLIGIAAMGFITLSLTIPLEMRGIGPIYGASAVGLVVAGQNAGGFLFPIIGGNLAETNQLWPFVFWATIISAAVIGLFLMRETSHK